MKDSYGRASGVARATEETSKPSSFKWDPKLHYFLFRMFLGPMIFTMIHIPGSIRRASQVTGTEYSENVSNNLASAQSFFDPSHGSINFILYVFLDVDLCKTWKNLIWTTQESLRESMMSNVGVSLNTLKLQSSVVEDKNSINSISHVHQSESENPIQSSTDDADSHDDQPEVIVHTDESDQGNVTS